MFHEFLPNLNTLPAPPGTVGSIAISGACYLAWDSTQNLVWIGATSGVAYSYKPVLLTGVNTVVNFGGYIRYDATQNLLWSIGNNKLVSVNAATGSVVNTITPATTYLYAVEYDKVNNLTWYHDGPSGSARLKSVNAANGSAVNNISLGTEYIGYTQGTRSFSYDKDHNRLWFVGINYGLGYYDIGTATLHTGVSTNPGGSYYNCCFYDTTTQSVWMGNSNGTIYKYGVISNTINGTLPGYNALSFELDNNGFLWFVASTGAGKFVQINASTLAVIYTNTTFAGDGTSGGVACDLTDHRMWWSTSAVGIHFYQTT